jgi:hypothetical protein
VVKERNPKVKPKKLLLRERRATVEHLVFGNTSRKLRLLEKHAVMVRRNI